MSKQGKKNQGKKNKAKIKNIASSGESTEENKKSDEESIYRDEENVYCDEDIQIKSLSICSDDIDDSDSSCVESEDIESTDGISETGDIENPLVLDVQEMVYKRLLDNSEEQMRELFEEISKAIMISRASSYSYKAINTFIAFSIIGVGTALGIISALLGTPHIVTIMSFVLVAIKSLGMVFRFGDRGHKTRSIQISLEILRDDIKQDASMYPDADQLLSFIRYCRTRFRRIQSQNNSQGFSASNVSEIVSSNIG